MPKKKTAQRQDLPRDSASTHPPFQYPWWLPDRGVAETRKAPSSEGALSILVTGQKKSAFSNFLKTLH